MSRRQRDNRYAVHRHVRVRQHEQPAIRLVGERRNRAVHVVTDVDHGELYPKRRRDRFGRAHECLVGRRI
jgi:hypothetical protein